MLSVVYLKATSEIKIEIFKLYQNMFQIVIWHFN